MGKLRTITRRTFMGLGLAGAGGLAVGYYYYKKPYDNPLLAMAAENDAVLTPYVLITPDNQITIIAPRAEMGQGVHTTLAALVAEELDVTLEQVNVIHGPASKAYYNEAMFVDGGPFPFFDESITAGIARQSMKVVSKFLALQVTGGSSASIDAYVKMREAGCAARMALVGAAAARWDVSADDLQTANGIIINPADGNRLTYGEVASDAAGMAPPSKLALRPRSEWKILGKSQQRVESLDKVTGAPIFGIDVQLPDMLYGTVKMSPHYGVGAKTFDKVAALDVSGVLDVIEIETTTGSGFGIIAENTWAAFQGAEALEVLWHTPPYPLDSAGMKTKLDEALAAAPDFELNVKGDEAPANISATYEVPYLAHTTMEPMNATAQLLNGKLELWLGTQAPGLAQSTCANLLGIDVEDITVNTLRMGGGFGRRTEVDVPLYAAAMAAKTGGHPIKVTWSREEDMTHDTYRPMAKGVFGASIVDGKLSGLSVDIASPSILGSIMGRTFPSLSPTGPEKIVLEGGYDQPSVIPNTRFSAHIADLPIPIGFWRSVGNSFNGFFYESFIDEVAAYLNQDPLDFRLSMLNNAEHKPAREVLKHVAAMSGWGTPLPAGKGRGIAHVISFGTWVAQVVQVDVTNGVKIEKVWCAADPGLVLDPANFKAQMMSGIVYGLSQALDQEVTFADGRVEQTNFPDFDAMRMAQCPEILVELLENAPKMGGAGEPGTPPSTPALANAIFNANGQRIRSMPLSREIDFI